MAKKLYNAAYTQTLASHSVFCCPCPAVVQFNLLLHIRDEREREKHTQREYFQSKLLPVLANSLSLVADMNT